MKRLIVALAASALMPLAVGCATCQHPGDCFYPAYGGIWQRQNQSHGRVGSLFDPDGGGPDVVTEGEVIYEGDAVYGGDGYYDESEMLPTPMPSR